MSAYDDDRYLRERFDSMRSAEAARGPTFERVLEAARSPRFQPRLSLAHVAVAAAVVVALGLAITRSLESPVPRAGEMLAEWTAPTDFLLRTPGSELLSSAPVFAPPKLERSLPR